MRFFIGPVSCLPVVVFLALAATVVQAQFSQDFRTSKSFNPIRFPGSTRPRTQLIQPQPRPRPQQQPQLQPQQQQFQAQPQQLRPNSLRDEVTQNAASNAANIALNNQNTQQSGRLTQPNQPAAIAQQTNFLTNRLPVPGVPTDELFTFAESRRVRYSPELAEQRAIADQQEFLLLQGTSARFLNRKTNSPEFAATLFAPDQQSVPIPVHEGFRSLPAFPAAQAQSAALQASPVNPVVAAFQAADPFIQPAYPTDPYAQPPAPYSQPPAPYTQPAAPYAQPPAPYQQPVIDPYSSYGASPYQTSGSYSYQSLPSQPDAGFNYGYDVFHG